MIFRALSRILAVQCLLLLVVSLAHAKVPDVVLKQKKAVVTIHINDRDGKQIATGSGFIIEPNGIIATNYHVISSLLKDQDARIAIKMENGEFTKAERLISFDESNDVALIKVEGKGLPSLPLAQDYKPKQGEDIVVIGSPFGLETTVSDGIISSIRGEDEFLQITAPISPGSSGSPVFNLNGDVIGIATLLIQGGQNLNFAIPAKYIKTLMATSWITKAAPVKVLVSDSVEHTKKKEGHTKVDGNADHHVKLAKEAFKKGQFDNAIEEYSEAITLRPSDAYLYCARGYALMKSAISKDSPLYENAIEDFDKAITLQPDNELFYFVRGFFSINEFKKALRDFEKAISLRSDIALFYYERGNAYLELGLHAQAIADFNKAINLKSDTQENLYSLFQRFYENIGDYSQLIQDDFVSVNSLSNYYFARGSAYEKSGQIGKAFEDFQESIKVDPESFAYSSLRDLYKKENNFNEAIDFYSKIISQKPKHAQPYLERAYFYRELKNYEKALKDYNNAILLNPVAHNFSSRGYVYQKLKQYDRAIKDYTKAIELDSNSAFDYSFRADLYVKKNQRERAKADFQKACSLEKILCWDFTEFEKEERRLEKDKVRGNKWVLFGEAGNNSFYYDKSGIRSQPNKHVKVWVRQEVNDVTAYVEERKHSYQATDGYENFSHALNLWMFDCGNRKIGTEASVEYDDKGKALESHNMKTFSMRPIVPDSIADKLYKIVCEKKKAGK